MKTKTKTHWSELELFDSDGCSPDTEEFARLMQEYRDTGGISDYYFVDPTEPSLCACGNPDPGPDIEQAPCGCREWPLYRDPWDENSLREPHDYGPEEREIDFSGVDVAATEPRLRKITADADDDSSERGIVEDIRCLLASGHPLNDIVVNDGDDKWGTTGATTRRAAQECVDSWRADGCDGGCSVNDLETAEDWLYRVEAGD